MQSESTSPGGTLSTSTPSAGVASLGKTAFTRSEQHCSTVRCSFGAVLEKEASPAVRCALMYPVICTDLRTLRGGSGLTAPGRAKTALLIAESDICWTTSSFSSRARSRASRRHSKPQALAPAESPRRDWSFSRTVRNF